MKKLLGHIGVDSGHVLITDPCYLSAWKDNEFKDIRIYELKGAKKIFRFGKDFSDYNDVIYKGLNMNQLIKSKKVTDVSAQYHNVFDYSYNGSCNRTLYDKRQGGEIGIGENGVVSCSGWGDGSYPVYAHYDKKTGRVSKLEIIFMEESKREMYERIVGES